MPKRLILVMLVAVTVAPPAHAAADGGQLYAANCSRCHGSGGRGLEDKGPSLHGVGARAADFYLRTGYMPIRDPHEQPERSRVLFSEDELKAMVQYVASLGSGPGIPSPHPERGSVSEGMRLFRESCSGCHQIVAAGGYATGGRVPPLEDATPRQVAEAIRIGPYLMPRFTGSQLTDRQIDSLIAYVQYAKHPDDAGGWSIGHLGPWPEGAVTWLIAAVSLVGLCVVIGKRLQS